MTLISHIYILPVSTFNSCNYRLLELFCYAVCKDAWILVMIAIGHAWWKNAWWKNAWWKNAWWKNAWWKNAWWKNAWWKNAWWKNAWWKNAWWKNAWWKNAWWKNAWWKNAWWKITDEENSKYVSCGCNSKE